MQPTDQVKFSICIPAYKARHLKVCIESILNQTVADFELIILNDCSPESIGDIVGEFVDKRIQYHENNSRVGALNLVDNWNKCLALARGEFIMIMGDDDLLEADYLEEFSRLIATHPQLEVWHCRSKIIDDAGQAILLTPSLPAFEDVYDSIWHRLNQWRSNYVSDYMYKTATLRERGGFFHLPFAWGSDDITAFIATAEKGIAHSNKPIFLYRQHGASISSNSSNDLGKLEADMGYAEWLACFLENPPGHLKDLTIYMHLLNNQKAYMHKRRIFTMAKLMMANPLPKAWKWFKHRKKLGIGTGEILIAAIKSRRMKMPV